MALEKELQTYKTKLPELLANEGEGKYALIHDDDLVDVFGTYEDAIKQGYAKFQLQPFLVKQIQTIEHVQSISRLVACHTSLAK
ncbi:MAG: hypothetical protein ABSF22_13700 [Bryobacteraceae bacterium]